MQPKQIRYSLRQLRYFVAAAETLSFTAAARALHVSQPSVSTALSDIEESFGVQLFIRHHAQGLSLTQTGQNLLLKARMLLRQAEELQTEAFALGDKIAGNIAIGCLISLAPQVVPTIMRDYRTQFSDISIHITDTDQMTLFDKLFDGSLEIALSYNIEVPSEIEFLPLADLPPYALLPPNHPLAEKKDLSLDDLVAYPYVLLDLPISREYFLSLFTNANLEPKISYKTTSSEVLKGIVANGEAFSLLNFPVQNKKTIDGRPFLTRTLHRDYKALVLGLMHVKGLHKRRVIEHFIDYSKQIAPGLVQLHERTP